jgi:hypothetical protein
LKRQTTLKSFEKLNHAQKLKANQYYFISPQIFPIFLISLSHLLRMPPSPLGDAPCRPQ